MSRKRSTLSLVILTAVLVTLWWGANTFLLDDPQEASDGPPVVKRAAPIDAVPPPSELDIPDLGPPTRAEAALDPTGPGGGPLAPGQPTRSEADETTTGAPSGTDADLISSGYGTPPRATVGITDGTRTGSAAPFPEDAEAWVVPGYAWIGTPLHQVEGMLGARGETAPPALPYEAPRHPVEMEGYWIERTEVTHQRYHRFLRQAAAIRFTTPVGRAETLVEIVQEIIGRRAPANWDVEITARQLYAANKAVLNAALPFLVVSEPVARRVDEVATWANFADARIPDGLELRFYDRAPPRYWIDDLPPSGRARHPVRDLSLLDATAFALWAGRHVPTEIEWEYAARGPRGLDLPWGDRSPPFEGRVNGGRPRVQGRVADTVAVTALADGASWVGAYNMLGNVAEWTSSWLVPYPESELPPLRHAVHRGGAAIDTDRLVIRTAYRGGASAALGEGGALSHDRPRPWVGARLARYEEPARSRTVAMHTRYLASEQFPADALEPRVYAGVQGERRRGPPVSDPDPAARLGAKAIVVQPLLYVAVPTSPEASTRPRVPASVTDTRRLAALSTEALVVLGLLHTDLRLEGLWEVGFRDDLPKPLLRQGTCPAGTWIVVIHEGHLGLLAWDLDDLWYVSRGGSVSPHVIVRQRPIGPRGWPRSIATLDGAPGSVRMRASFEMPLGNTGRRNLGVRVRLDLRLHAPDVQAIVDRQAGSLGE